MLSSLRPVIVEFSTRSAGWRTESRKCSLSEQAWTRLMSLRGKVDKTKGVAFWHRLTLPQLTFAIDAPILVPRGLTPLSRIGAGALVARLVHRMNGGRAQPLPVSRHNARSSGRSCRAGTRPNASADLRGAAVRLSYDAVHRVRRWRHRPRRGTFSSLAA